MNTKTIHALFLMFGLAIGYAIAENLNGDTTDDVVMGTAPIEEGQKSAVDMSSIMMMSHTHASLEVDPQTQPPTLAIDVLSDVKDGYNLHLITTNYTFTPENVNKAPVQNEGHAHLYVNGVKKARLYGEWFSIHSSDLLPGENLIEVTLNANDHSEWSVGGSHIYASAVVTK